MPLGVSISLSSTFPSFFCILCFIFSHCETLIDLFLQIRSSTISILFLVFYFHLIDSLFQLDFPGGSDGKKRLPTMGEDPGLIPGSGRSPREGNGNPLQYSCLENPMDGGAWWATVHGVIKSLAQL